MRRTRSMLPGRESLIRLVGKRRRNLPRHLLLATPQQQPLQPSASPFPSSTGAASKVAVFGSEGSAVAEEDRVPSDRDSDGACAFKCSSGGDPEALDTDWVECPVCGQSIRGMNHVVNSHLDSCLARGTKRKSTQRTLLDLNFCSRTKVQGDLSGSGGPRIDSRKLELNENGKCDADCMTLDESLANNEKKYGVLESLSQSYFDEKIRCEVFVDRTIELDSFDCEPAEEPRPLCLLPSANGVNNLCSRRHLDEEHISATVLETFIVGRKFHSGSKLFQGTNIYLLRDLENPKDQNAIKVFSSNSGNGEMLGYIPKELAKQLAPLIDRYHLKFEGLITSIPSQSLGPVPVQLFCKGMIPNELLDPSDDQHLESLWENVLRIAKSLKESPSGITKYQHNFHVMLHEVMKIHAHLFTLEENDFLECLSTLSDDSQRIFIRLYSRKGPWFRMSNISYTEVLDSQKALEELQWAGYLCSFSSTEVVSGSDIAEVLEMLTVVELRELANLIPQKKSTASNKKRELVSFLSATYEEGACSNLPKMIVECVGTCVKISSSADLLLWRIQRLFFLNGEQDLSAFLLIDLGLVKYPSYNCRISQPVFPHRKDLLAYDEAIMIAQMLDEAIEENNVDMVMACIRFSDGSISVVPESLPNFLLCFSASWVYSKVLTLGVSFCEQERMYQESVGLLKGLLRRIACGGKRGYWTLRLSIDLEHMGCVNESLSVAEEGISDPWVRSGSKMALQRRVLRLGKPPRRWKKPTFAESISRKIVEVHVRGRPLNCEIGAKNRYYGYDGEQCSVEQLALQYYADEGGGWKGVHAESGIWLTIFALLMWDVIFSDVPDVFQTRFQTSPLDLDTDSFYTSRENIIETHLQKIQDGMAEEILISSWEVHVGTACRGVNWDRHCLSNLRAAVACIGASCLASLCRHLAQDYRSWSRGMPDLLLWRFFGEDGRDGGEAKLVEVKGPRDRLSEQQRAWLLLLMDCGFQAEVCRVSATA